MTNDGILRWNQRAIKCSNFYCASNVLLLQALFYLYRLKPEEPYALGVDIHSLVAHRYLRYTNITSNLILSNNLLVEYRRCALGEGITLQLRALLVGLDEVSLQSRLVACDNRHIHVRTRTQVVENTSHDSITCQLHGLILCKIRLPLRLKHRHGRQTTTAHGDVGQLIRGAVGVDGEEVSTGGIYTRDDEVGTDVSLVAEQVLLEEGHAGDDAGFATGGEGV